MCRVYQSKGQTYTRLCYRHGALKGTRLEGDRKVGDHVPVRGGRRKKREPEQYEICPLCGANKLIPIRNLCIQCKVVQERVLVTPENFSVLDRTLPGEVETTIPIEPVDDGQMQMWED